MKIFLMHHQLKFIVGINYFSEDEKFQYLKKTKHIMKNGMYYVALNKLLLGPHTCWVFFAQFVGKQLNRPSKI